MATRKIVTGATRNKRGQVTAVETTTQRRRPIAKTWKDVKVEETKVPWYKRR